MVLEKALSFLDGSKELSFIFRKESGYAMIKAKVGGIVLGGLAGYLLLSKGIHALERCVSNICDANKWKNYYKYSSKHEGMMPPGYVMKTSESGETSVEPEANDIPNASQKPQEGSISDSVAKAIDSLFNKEKKPEGASEGETEGIERDISVIHEEECPADCENCQVEDCPYEYHDKKPGEKKDNLKDFLNMVDKMHDDIEQKTGGEKDPFYVDDLADGVKEVDPEEEDEEDDQE